MLRSTLGLSLRRIVKCLDPPISRWFSLFFFFNCLYCSGILEKFMLTEPYVQAHVYRADGFLVGNPAHIMQRTSRALQHRHGLGWIESIPSKNWGHWSCLSCLYPVAKISISGSQPWPVQELSHLARKLMCSNCHSRTKGRQNLFIFMSKDTSQVLSIVQNWKNVRGLVSNFVHFVFTRSVGLWHSWQAG